MATYASVAPGNRTASDGDAASQNPETVTVASLSDPNSNPLYVHAADHAGISLVTEKLAGLGNFTTWRRSMIMALSARNKLVFVNGSYPELSETHPDYSSWFRCNSIVCTWLVNAVDKQIAKSIMYLDTARQMWLDIHDQFKQSDGPRTAEIKQLLFAEVQGQQSISEYYTRLKQLWEELKNHENPYTCCCGMSHCQSFKKLVAREEQDKVLKFLMGLNDTYKTTRGQILMMEPKPSITKVFNLVSQEERQRNMSSGHATNTAVFQASHNNNEPPVEVIAAYGYNKGKARPVCSHCGLQGHTVNRCYKLHGYPQGYKTSNGSQKTQSSNKSQQQWNQNKENAANMVIQDVSNNITTTQDRKDVNVGNYTTEQVQQLLSALKISPEMINNFSQVTGSTFNLPDGSVSVSQPQPHIVPHTNQFRSLLRTS